MEVKLVAFYKRASHNFIFCCFISSLRAGFWCHFDRLLLLSLQWPCITAWVWCCSVYIRHWWFCGEMLWLLVVQFRYMSTASECLFSLVNGDDIFTTFATINDMNVVMWWYSRVYLYVFVSLFIYVILSVFISVIMDTYETLKVLLQSQCWLDDFKCVQPLKTCCRNPKTLLLGDTA